MLRLSALCLIVMMASAARMPAQVYPYRDGTPGVTGYRSEVMAEVMIQESEFVRLAEAIPADKYTWRPSPDVRTIAEVFLHAPALPTTISTDSWALRLPPAWTLRRWSSPPATKEKS